MTLKVDEQHPFPKQPIGTATHYPYRAVPIIQIFINKLNYAANLNTSSTKSIKAGPRLRELSEPISNSQSLPLESF
jgi:hypothetical protein